jgi:hypothetical protein
MSTDDVPRDVDLQLTNTPWPNDQNLIAWTYDPALAHNASLLTNGTVYLAGIEIRRVATIRNILWWITTSGATPVSSQNFVGLYGSDGVRLATVNVDSSVAGADLITTPLATPLTVYPGPYWVGMVFNATTAPSVARATGQSGATTAVNAGLPTAKLRYCTNATSQTSLPATLTLASNAALAFAGPWVAVS